MRPLFFQRQEKGHPVVGQLCETANRGTGIRKCDMKEWKKEGVLATTIQRNSHLPAEGGGGGRMNPPNEPVWGPRETLGKRYALDNI